jgi:hypothetical protein
VRTSDPIMCVNLSTFLYYLGRGSRTHIMIIAVHVLCSQCRYPSLSVGHETDSLLHIELSEGCD